MNTKLFWMEFPGSEINNKTLKIYPALIIVGILLFPVFGSPFQAEGKASDFLPLDRGWQYAWGTSSRQPPADAAWRPYSIKQFSAGNNPPFLWLKIRLKPQGLICPALLLLQYGSFQAFEIRQADRLIYASGVMKDAFINKHLYSRWLLIPIPPDYPDSDLYFRFFSVHPSHIGFFFPPRLGEYDRLLLNHISHDMDGAIIAVLFILIGAAAFLFLLLYYKMKNQAVFYFSVMAVSAGNYLLSETAVIQLFWSDPITLSYSLYLSLLLMMAGCLAFFDQIIQTGWKISVIRLSWKLTLLYIAVFFVSEVFDLTEKGIFFETVMSSYAVIIPMIGAEVVTALNRGTREFRILSAGVLIHMTAGFIDFLVGLQILMTMRMLYPYSLSILIGTMAYTLFKRYRNERKAMEAALEEAERMRRSEEDAIVEERRRIAREIHDGIAQEMAQVKLKTALWHKITDQHPEQMHAELNWLDALLKKNIRDIRRCIMALRPVDLDELGFEKAVRHFVCEFGRHNEIWADFSLSGEPEAIPARLEPVFYRIIQEALNNTARHADASLVRILLECLPGQALDLTVSDDGKGFDTDTLPAVFNNGHLGLKQMKERVENLAGSFIIRSAEGAGTEIHVTIPLSIKNGATHYGRKRDKCTHCG